MSAQAQHIAVANHKPRAADAKFTKNVVTQPQFFQLCKWVETPNILDGCWSFGDVAKKATAILGFMISDSTIKRALDTTGVKMPEAAAVNNLRRDRTTVIGEALLALMRELGHEASQELLRAVHPKGKE